MKTELWVSVGEQIRIGEQIRLMIVKIGNDYSLANVRIGIEAPSHINIVRSELVDR